MMLATPPFWASSKKALLRANNKPPVELVVDDLILHNGSENKLDLYKYKNTKKIQMEKPYNYHNIFECLYALLIN